MGIDLIYDVIEEAIDASVEPAPFCIWAAKFEQALEQLGYMIVPIEDPTNLRYGADD